MVHWFILGGLERSVGVPVEHFGGRFPIWRAPIQVASFLCARSMGGTVMSLRGNLKTIKIAWLPYLKKAT